MRAQTPLRPHRPHRPHRLHPHPRTAPTHTPAPFPSLHSLVDRKFLLQASNACPNTPSASTAPPPLHSLVDRKFPASNACPNPPPPTPPPPPPPPSPPTPPPPHGPYCLHSLLYIESSHIPPGPRFLATTHTWLAFARCLESIERLPMHAHTPPRPHHPHRPHPIPPWPRHYSHLARISKVFREYLKVANACPHPPTPSPPPPPTPHPTPASPLPAPGCIF